VNHQAYIFVQRFLLDAFDMTGHTIGRLSIFVWRHVTPMLLILAFSSILTVGILDGFRYEVWTYREVSIENIILRHLTFDTHNFYQHSNNSSEIF